MPSATRPLTSAIDFCRSPWPMRTTCLTFGHLAASERTAAIDDFDQPLMPKPSWMPSVISFVPQNEVSFVTPEAARICSAVISAAAAGPAKPAGDGKGGRGDARNA